MTLHLDVRMHVGQTRTGGILNQKTIFVVDDDQSVQNFLFSFLSIRGYKVACFGSGDELMSRLSSGGAPGLILLDVVMPDCDGVTVLQKVQALGLKVTLGTTEAGDE